VYIWKLELDSNKNIVLGATCMSFTVTENLTIISRPASVSKLEAELTCSCHCNFACGNNASSVHFLQLFHTSDDDDRTALLISATPPCPQPVENCCAMSVFVHGSLVYDSSSAACPVHQDVSPHTYNLHCVVTGL